MKQQTINIYLYKEYLFEIIGTHREDHDWVDIWIMKNEASNVKVKVDFFFDKSFNTPDEIIEVTEKIKSEYDFYVSIYKSFMEYYQVGFKQTWDEMFVDEMGQISNQNKKDEIL